MVKGISLVGLTLLLMGCVDSERVDSDRGNGEVTQTPPAQQEPQVLEPASDAARNARMIALDNQIRTMVGIARADSLQQCKLAEVGKRACGGPEYYIAYSTQVTDEDALQKLVREYTQLRIEHIQETQEMSTCEMLPRPQLTLDNGICRASDAQGASVKL